MSIRERTYPDQESSGTLLKSECLAALRLMPDNSVDSIVTDPPYELGMMNKTWDSSGIAYSVEFWTEALRVLKPGGHLLAAGGTRTYHRMACAIEDAGFEIRDSISWIYGSGYPKSLDKAAGAEREVVGSKKVNVGIQGGKFTAGSKTGEVNVTIPATDAAKQWQGFGTALKPSVEPFVLARKPIVGTVANNVLTYGTGALNIDASRIESTDSQLAEKYASVRNAGPRNNAIYGGDLRERSEGNVEPHALGRFPANLILDNSDEVVAGFPDTSKSTGGRMTNISTTSSIYGGGKGLGQNLDADDVRGDPGYGDEGSAARYFKSVTFEDDDVQSFFYCPKAGSSERDAGLEGIETRHPTVKPIALMRYLIKLVTPPGGVVLDPFLGSGTTAVAAILDGFDWIGCEMTEEYWPIIGGRVAWAEEVRFRTPPSLFDADETTPSSKTIEPMRATAEVTLF